MRWRMVGFGLVVALLVASCGDDDGDDAGGVAAAGDEDAAESATDLPEECVDPPLTITIDGGEALPGIDGAEFEVTSAVVGQQPIVPDPDRALGIEDVAQAAADAELIAYTVYLADFPVSAEDLSGFGYGDPPVDGTYLAFSIVPPTDEPLAAGDVVVSGKPDFESITTFATMGTQFATGTTDDPPALAMDTEGSGEAEVLYLDDERICLAWSQSGTLFGAEAPGEWSIEAVIGGELAPRGRVPLS